MGSWCRSSASVCAFVGASLSVLRSFRVWFQNAKSGTSAMVPLEGRLN